MNTLFGQVTAKRLCDKCRTATDVMLVRNITSSGISQVYWYCINGKHATKTGGFIAHSLVKSQEIDIEKLPVINDYRGERCVVCDSPEVEYHHFAPRHLFGDDADKWPTGYLCKAHHTEWHDKVTPNMCRRKDDV